MKKGSLQMNNKMTGVISFLCVISCTMYGDFQASFKAGRKAFSQKQYEEALKNYQEAALQTSIPGQRYQTLRAMAEVYKVQGDWKKTEDTLAQILKDESIPAANRMSAQVFLGDCKLKQKNITAAVAEYQKVSAYGIQNKESHYAMLSCGTLYTQLKKFDEAKKCYQTLVDDSNVDAGRKNRAKVGMGNVLYLQGKYIEAVSLLTAITADPELPADLRADAFTVIARSQYKMKAYEDACKTDLAIIALEGIPAYFKAGAYMHAIAIQGGIFRNYPLAKKLLDDFEKMPGVTASQKKWITDQRAKIRKAEHTL